MRGAARAPGRRRPTIPGSAARQYRQFQSFSESSAAYNDAGPRKMTALSLAVKGHQLPGCVTRFGAVRFFSALSLDVPRANRYGRRLVSCAFFMLLTVPLLGVHSAVNNRFLVWGTSGSEARSPEDVTH